MWDQVTIGYLAGLIDGEGYIKVHKHGVQISVISTDYDIIERAHDMSGIGTIQGPYFNKNRVKPNWRWCVSPKKDVARLLCAITPLMSERRRMTQILPAAEYISDHIPRPKVCEREGCDNVFTPEEGLQLRRKYCTRACTNKAYKMRKKQTTQTI